MSKRAQNTFSNPIGTKEIESLIEEMDRVISDPETLKAAEKLHKKLSYLSPEDLLRPFTI